MAKNPKPGNISQLLNWIDKSKIAKIIVSILLFSLLIVLGVFIVFAIQGREVSLLQFSVGEKQLTTPIAEIVETQVEATMQAYILPTSTLDTTKVASAVGSTLAAIQKSSTAVPNLETTQTPITYQIAPADLPAGEDIENNCLSINNWKLAGNGTEDFVSINSCWVLDEDFILLEQGDMKIISGRLSEKKSLSLYTPSSEFSTIKFKIKIDKFSTSENNTGFLCLGFGSENAVSFYDDKSEKLVCFSSYSNESLVNTYVNQAFYKYYNGCSYMALNHSKLTSQDELSVVFDINSSLLTISVSGADEVEPIRISSSDREYFWITYDLEKGQELIATIEEIEFLP